MKRFYCTVCKRQVRVRRLPDGVHLIEGPKGPVYSKGVCRHHTSSDPRTIVQQRARSRPTAAPQVVAVAAKRRA